MIYELPVDRYDRVRPLIKGRKDIYVHSLAIIDGNNRGKIYVDNVDSPKTALVWAIGCMYFLLGDSDNDDFNNSLDEYINCVLGPDSLKTCGGTHFAVTLYEDGWIKSLENVFKSSQIEEEFMQLYVFNPFKFRELKTVLPDIPEGYTVQRISREIVRNDAENIIASDVLGDFWVSVESFLDKGFGYCVLNGNKVISDCFTGYVSGNIHDIAIRTYGDENGRKGFATLAARAYIEYCMSNGLTPLWFTSEFNTGSNTIARKCGFDLYKKCKMICFPFKQ